jgi:HAD superfamily hydrolase (TIGR01459 family)
MSAAQTPRPISGLADLADDYDLILSDVWGVVHDGVTHTPSAADALTRYRAQGGKVLLLTNAPRPNDEIRPMLDRMGLPRSAYDGIVSSGDVTVDLMAARGTAPVYHLGPSRDEHLFEALRQRVGADPRKAFQQADYVVCSGLMVDSDPLEPYLPLLQAMRARNLPMICANPDIVVHVGDDLVLCAGALAKAYSEMGGAVIQAGKPHAIIYKTALLRAAYLFPDFSPKRILAIGDGMGTDMKGAAEQNFDGLFISGGIHRQALRHDANAVDEAAYQALCAEYNARPIAHLPALYWRV